MKIVGIMPLKLNNERLPGKNTKILGNKPLFHYELDSALTTNMVDSIYVYCSDDSIIPLIPKKIHFLKRPSFLDLPSSNFTQIFECFSKEVNADIYVYLHATAPFVSVNTIKELIDSVKSGSYDSAFCAEKIQTYLWENNKPLNFDASNLPRTQDLKPIYKETSGVYVFNKEVFEKYKRRIGVNPFVKEISYKEAIDIDEQKDFDLAQIFIKEKENSEV